VSVETEPLFPAAELERAPLAEPAVPPVPPGPRERFLAEVREVLPEGFVMRARQWERICEAGDEYAAAMVEKFARRPGKCQG
jgi:hypothetical protein